jgi:hypothetical protein
MASQPFSMGLQGLQSTFFEALIVAAEEAAEKIKTLSF